MLKSTEWVLSETSNAKVPPEAARFTGVTSTVMAPWLSLWVGAVFVSDAVPGVTARDWVAARGSQGNSHNGNRCAFAGSTPVSARVNVTSPICQVFHPAQ
jgi:hypothetical protein